MRIAAPLYHHDFQLRDRVLLEEVSDKVAKVIDSEAVSDFCKYGEGYITHKDDR